LLPNPRKVCFNQSCGREGSDEASTLLRESKHTETQSILSPNKKPIKPKLQKIAIIIVLHHFGNNNESKSREKNAHHHQGTWSCPWRHESEV